MEVSFCKQCENMLYIYADTDEHELYHACRVYNPVYCLWFYCDISTYQC